MGQKQAPSHSQPVTFEQVQQSIKSIFDDQQTKYQTLQIAIPVQRILQNLSDNIPAQKTEEGFVLNHKMIQIFYHKAFLFSMGKLINLLIDKLEEIGQRSLIMVQRDEWKFCLNLANFIIFFTDDKLIRMMETVSIRSDLSQNTQNFIQALEKQGNEFSATQSLIDKLSFSEIERIEKCFRISMNQMISMRTQVITRSQITLKVLQKLQQACFILYLKALYSPQHTQSILNKAKHPQFLKSNLTIAHYFLGKGCDMAIPSIYESAVLFLFNLITKNKPNLKQFKSLPTHLFKTLPIVSQNTIYDFVMNICLYSLTYIKENNNFYSRFALNRIMTLKLLDLIVKDVKVSSAQITYYLEEICLQTKIGMIERSFVTDLVQNYLNLVQQTIENAKANESKPVPSSSKIKPVGAQSVPSLKLARQHHISQILTKYLEGGKQNYNIKYSNKKWKITTVDIVTELQNDENIIQTEFRILCEKYIYEVVLGKRVIYQYNDRQIWSEILPNIIEDKCVNSSDQGEGNQEEISKGYKSEMRRQEDDHTDSHAISTKQTKSEITKPSNNPSNTAKQTTQQPQSKLIQVSNHTPEQTPISKLQTSQPETKQLQEEDNFEDAVDHENQEKKQQPQQTIEEDN